MKRTSIFSREYERRLRIRRFLILFITIFFSVLLVYYIINFSKFNNYLKNVYYSMIIGDEGLTDENGLNKNQLDENQKDTNTSDNYNENISEIIEEKSFIEHLKYEIDLSNDEKVNILYTKDNDRVEFLEDQKELEKIYTFDISPSKNKILIENIETQDTYIIDENLSSFKLDPEFFYSNSARSKFYKKDVMENYPDYAWYKNAKFLTDNSIVYVSNLPWFGKNEQYIWRTDIENLDDILHFMTSVSGQNITFGELTEEGIKVNINNEIKTLTLAFVLN